MSNKCEYLTFVFLGIIIQVLSFTCYHETGHPEISKSVVTATCEEIRELPVWSWVRGQSPIRRKGSIFSSLSLLNGPQEELSCACHKLSHVKVEWRQ